MSASTDMESLTHYHLKAETFEDEDGPMVRLEQQEGIDDTMVIVVHPWQLRAACQQLGILHADPEAERTTARLTRRLAAVTERIEQLNEYLQAYGATEYVNLRSEQAYSQATADLAAEFAADVKGPEQRAPEQGVLL